MPWPRSAGTRMGAWTCWLPGPARRRRERQAEEFITLLRRSAALLQAGRRPDRIWAELSGLYEPCRGGPSVPDEGNAGDTASARAAGHPMASGPVARAGCCLHHVLVEAEVEILLGASPFAGVAGPGTGRHWRQLDGCLAVAREAGIPLAGLLERLADALDEGQDAQQARDAAAAGPRSTARLLGLLPLAGLGLSALAGAPPTELLAGPLGWLVVGTGGGLAAVGHWWTRTLIRRSEGPS
jgi:tight adherence protein B